MVEKCAHVDESALVDLCPAFGNEPTAPLSQRRARHLGSAAPCLIASRESDCVLHLWQRHERLSWTTAVAAKGMPVECETSAL
jgi:hypothetical protein